VTSSGITQGLSLLPGEETLFAEFPDVITPYAATVNPRHKKPHPKVVSYQMVQDPCPLYDPGTKTCTQYDKRPTICKAYPFSFMGAEIEANCGWRKSVQITYGETAVTCGKEQVEAELKINSFFSALHQRMQRTGRTQLILYDIALQGWVQPVAEG